MNEPTYFVVVFGDPKQNGDTIESGRYESGDGYPVFTVQPGDMLLLYCTEGYADYPKQFPGIGVAIRAGSNLIEYRRIPFAKTIPRALIDQTFEPEDHKKMGELRFNRRRAFDISPQSFWRTVANQPIGQAV
jgi:hypothetical protein